jgi:hypothetical protein
MVALGTARHITPKTVDLEIVNLETVDLEIINLDRPIFSFVRKRDQNHGSLRATRGGYDAQQAYRHRLESLTAPEQAF